MNLSLFDDEPAPSERATRLGEHAVVLRGWALPHVAALWPALQAVIAQAPFRHMHTPGGQRMQVALSNCGALGWVSDRRGYRYDAFDPDTQQRWPALPPAFTELATSAAAQAGFEAFAPDACLINRYTPGTRLSLHQDRDEQDFSQPIVSVSLGLPAVFLWGGAQRADRPQRVPLLHGDVVVWGGADRLRFHGVAPVPEGLHPLTGVARINFTFRRAG